MTICKGKRYIKPTCDKCVELPYCKPTEKTKFKKAQQVYNKFLFDSHIKTLREVELQEKRIATVELNAKVARGDFLTLEERVDTLTERVSGLETSPSRATHNARLEKLETSVKHLEEDRKALFPHNHTPLEMWIDKLETRVEDRSDDYHSHIRQLVTENEQEHEKLDTAQAFLNKDRLELSIRVEKLESLVGTLQRHGEEICRLESQVVVLEGTIKEHNVKIHRLETHIDVMESNARVATECSNKQAHAIEALQTEIHFIKERLGRCQDSVAELDPLGCVTVRKRGRPPKTKL